MSKPRFLPLFCLATSSLAASAPAQEAPKALEPSAEHASKSGMSAM